jgi:predicted GNAT family acetyltransferase
MTSAFAVLDNPVWNALASGHLGMARRHGGAARYARDVSPLVGVRDPAATAFADLWELVAPGETVGLVTSEPVEVPTEWQVARTLLLDQMVCERPVACEGLAVPAVPLLDLRADDVPDMVALAQATRPGPFAPGTISMGRYRGLRAPDGRLMAMAGERVSLDGFTEISAVCTDPDFRGRGHAQALVADLVAWVFAQGRVPFLHMTTDNPARRIYEKLGFRVRRPMWFTVLGRD